MLGVKLTSAIKPVGNTEGRRITSPARQTVVAINVRWRMKIVTVEYTQRREVGDVVQPPPCTLGRERPDRLCCMEVPHHSLV